MKIKYNIPEYTQLIKISSFYINLDNNINRQNTVNYIIKYIFDIYDIEIDIICIQGINDISLVKILVDGIKRYSDIIKIPVFIIPDIKLDNVIFDYDNKSDDNNNINSITISKYPVLTSSIVSLSNSIENLSNPNKCIIINVNIEGYVISIFNITLSKDFLGISNIDCRKQEIKKLREYIKINNDTINKWIDNCGIKIINKNVNIICGNFNIPKIKNSKMNTELLNILKYLDAIDVNNIHTNIINSKLDNNECHILSQLKKNAKLLDNNSIIKYSFKKLGIACINSYIRKKICSNNYHPIEAIFLLNKKEKRSLKEI